MCIIDGGVSGIWYVYKRSGGLMGDCQTQLVVYW